MSTIQDDEQVALLEETAVAVMLPSAAGALNKSEVEAQLDAAHKYRRSVRQFMNDAITLATLDVEIAESCLYSLPRGGKTIDGPSVRLAEICASAYGNLHIGARVVGVEEKEVVAQGVCWDLEKNIRVTIESRRRITNRQGRRYDDDMITVTGNAAASIGLRNAIFRVIPRAYVNQVYRKAREVAVGTASTLAARRQTVMERLVKMGAMPDRILAKIGKPSVDDITLDDIAVLIGLGTAIKDGNATVDETFPAAQPPDKGKVNLADIKPGTEENRGHGNENIKAGDQLTEQLEKSVAALICTAEDWQDIETAAADGKVKMSKVYEHIMSTMGCKPAESLPKSRKGEVTAWIAAQKR